MAPKIAFSVEEVNFINEAYNILQLTRTDITTKLVAIFKSSYNKEFSYSTLKKRVRSDYELIPEVTSYVTRLSNYPLNLIFYLV